MHDRGLLLSIHDVAPAFEPQLDGLINLVTRHVGGRFSMLVVPSHWASEPLGRRTPFAARLREWADAGVEMFLHGWSHRDDCFHRGPAALRARHMTAGEGEFLGLPEAEAIARIERGRALLEDIIGRPISGFVAPAWLYGDGAMAALTKCRIAIAEDHFRVWSPVNGRRLLNGPVITWASRTPARMRSSLLVAMAARTLPMPAMMRVAVHPGDTSQPRIIHSIDSTLAALARTRRPATYSALLERDQAAMS
jgi:predicted deacetylase